MEQISTEFSLEKICFEDISVFRFSLWLGDTHTQAHTRFLQFTGIEFIVMRMVVVVVVVLHCVTSTNVYCWFISRCYSLLRPFVFLFWYYIYYTCEGIWHGVWSQTKNIRKHTCVLREKTHIEMACLLTEFICFFFLLHNILFTTPLPLPLAISIFFGFFRAISFQFRLNAYRSPDTLYYTCTPEHIAQFLFLFILIKYLCIFMDYVSSMRHKWKIKMYEKRSVELR